MPSLYAVMDEDMDELKEENSKLKLQQWRLINFLLLNDWDEEFINDILNGTFYHKEVK